MSKQFIPCPACGVVGQVGKKCTFCSTMIVLKEEDIPTSERAPQRRIVTQQQYAEKISIYHKVKPCVSENTILAVSIGDQHGLININGDIIYPLGNEEIGFANSDTVALGHTYEDTIIEASTSWNKISERWEHEDAIKIDRFAVSGYFNLNTGKFANKHGFVKDTKNPSRMYRVDVKNGWKKINTYTNFEGAVHTYDYAEQIILSNSHAYRREMYLLHHGKECSLWILYDEFLDRNYFSKNKISSSAQRDALEANPVSPMCVFEGIQNQYNIKTNNEVVQIIVRTSEKDVPLTLAKKKQESTIWKYNNCDEIYEEWRKVVSEQVKEPKAQLDKSELESTINKSAPKSIVNKNAPKNNETILGHSKMEWLICIIGFILFFLYRIFKN